MKKTFMWHEAKVVTRSCYFGHRGIKWSANSEVTRSCGCCISAENTDINKIKIGHSSMISKSLALWRNLANSKNKGFQVERVNKEPHSYSFIYLFVQSLVFYLVLFYSNCVKSKMKLCWLFFTTSQL